MAKFKIEDMASLVNGSLYEAAEQANDVRSGIVLQLQENQKQLIDEFVNLKLCFEDKFNCIADILRQIEINTYKEK